MERPTEVPSGTYHWPIPRGTELKVDVAHDGKEHNRLVHLVWPHVVKGVEDVIAPGIGLRIVPPYLPYKNEEGEIEESELHDTQAFVWLTGDLDSQAITFDHIWTLCYVFFTLWPGELAFILVVPEEENHMEWVVRVVASRLAAQDYLISSHDLELYPNIKNVLYVSKTTFWQGAGAKEGSWTPILPFCFKGGPSHHLLRYCFPPGDSDLAAKCKGASVFVDLRDRMLSTPFYERYIPEMGRTVTFRLADPYSETDAQAFGTRYLRPQFQENLGSYHGLQWNSPKSWEDELVDSTFFSLICEWDEEVFEYVRVYDDSNDRLCSHDFPADWALFFMNCQDAVTLDAARFQVVIRSLVHMMFLLFPKVNTVATLHNAHHADAIENLIAAGGHIDRVQFRRCTHLPKPYSVPEVLVVFPRTRFFQYFPIGPAYIEGMINRLIPERDED